MQMEPVVFESTRDRDGIPYRITVRGRVGEYHSLIVCPACDLTEAGAKATSIIRAITGAKASLDSHHNMNHRVGVASLR
jgi:hypothetical protein